MIYLKLEAFIKKFYTNELLKGLIFFIGLGLLYLLLAIFVEYFLWLPPIGRTMLFWSFIIVALILLTRFILFPVFKLFKLQRGINYEVASAIIGNHFSEVSDKLINFLQLSNDDNQSELLLASIEQKALSLQPIPFGNAINFKANRKYLPLALLPILLILVFYASGNSNIISQSLNRVVHFDAAFLPPAPFQFIILNPNLQTEQNTDFILKVKTQGKVIPENVKIVIGDESYFMENQANGLFQFKIEKPFSNVLFHIEANEVYSNDYELEVVAVPTIANFGMVLEFPSYLNKKPSTIKGNGNAIVPEGTLVTWMMHTLATNSVNWTDFKSNFYFTKTENLFTISKKMLQNTEYQIGTSNNKIKNYEKLNYQIAVIKDQFPSIEVNAAPDSLQVAKNFVLGTISDDYGLSRLQIVYYPKDSPSLAKRGIIAIKKDIYDQFVFAFPSNLKVEQGVSYDYYFEVFDNDALHHFKSTKSVLFSNRIATDSEKEDQVLQQQNDNINSLEKSLKTQNKQLSEMDKLQKTAKEKDQFEFKDQQKVNDFIKRQKQQDEMMQSFSKKMEDNLDHFKTDHKDEFKESLQNRLEKVDADLEKNQKLLDELQKLNDKINNEQLLEKLETFKQNSKNQTKNLEQLVALTKKYYIEKKAEQLAEKLNQLSKSQEYLSNKDKENNADKQQEINSEFNKLQQELNSLDKENESLKSPISLPDSDQKEQSIDEDLKKAASELQKQNQAKAKPKQKSAAKKMQELSLQMKESMSGSAQEQLEEDVKMLRQILDNLLAYSFSQESVMVDFNTNKQGSPSFNKSLKTQQDLKLQFKHVDDSLFAMSLRNPKIAENVTKEIGNVHYNIDKALASLVDSQLAKGVSHQQYAVSSSNRLADFLSDILNQMQMDMSGSGSGSGGKPKPGQGQGMQLSDIIKKQEGLGQQVKAGFKQGTPRGQSGKSGKSGEKGSEGQQGKDGEGDAEAIMKVYQEQRHLREALQKALDKEGLGGNGNRALDQMKQIEKQLLNKGFNNESLQKMLNLKYELLKLDQALQQQGEEKKRQSQTNQKQFENRSNALPASLKEYLNSIEILNRQSLPLRQNYNHKVQQYFRKDD